MTASPAEARTSRPPHALAAEQVLCGLETGRGGLDSAEAARRLESHGPNRLSESVGRAPWRILLDQFRGLLIGILIGAAGLSALIGELADAVAILVILLLNAALGFYQEYRAERAMEALRSMAAPSAVVLRDGQPRDIAADGLVPGDVCLLQAGDVVPADLRLLEANSLRIDEAPLTGESVAVEKTEAGALDPAADVGERSNIAHATTLVTHGSATGVVIATGMSTEVGHIAGLLQRTEAVRTPLQRRLDVFGRRIGVAALAICAVIFLMGVLRGQPWLTMLMVAVSLAVAAVPEALPAVVTVALALGARRMVSLNALARRLSAVETLGSVTVICSDKTGTLTQSTMTAEEIALADEDLAAGQPLLPDESPPLAELLLAALLCNDAADPHDSAAPQGDPTEVALRDLALRNGLERRELLQSRPRVAELPFDSERKRMSTVHAGPDGLVVYVKGALESVLQRSTRLLTRDGPIRLDQGAGGRLREREEAMAGRGLRVLALARRELETSEPPEDPEQLERDLTLLGLVGLMDPPRPEAAGAVEECHRAGIRPIMITGDHPLTARAIAERLGIWKEGGRIVTGRELEAGSAGDLAAHVSHATVFARVSPEHKLRIVEALQASGELVAMTGDGVNDAPALKRAEIGVAMGITGTEVAKEASAMVLLDDRFQTIVAAVREGRRIFDNIRRFVRYTMTTNSGEIWVVLLAPLLGFPVPLLPIQILWINLVTDGLPGIALAVEPAERNVMRRPPRRPDESIFAHGMGYHIVFFGLLLAAVSLAGLFYGHHGRGQEDHHRTMVFTVLALGQMAHCLAIRSEIDSLFRQGLRSNLWVLGAVSATVALQLAVVYAPPLQAVLHTHPLSADELLVALGLSAVVFAGVELEKLFRRRRLHRKGLL
jgi:P-type Ca2+ transporter type 2C